MALLAPASKTVRNKNLIMVLMFLVFTGLFTYDGWWGYPLGNDRLVKTMQEEATAPKTRYRYTPEDQDFLNSWPGWEHADTIQRDAMAGFAKNKGHDAKSDLSIAVQKWLVLGLSLTTVASMWWFFKCQRRRATADEQGLSPEPSVSIAWHDITKVDNTQWKKKGIVDLEYRDQTGQTQTAALDDYLLDDLLPILDMLSERAEKAEFINPEVVEKTDQPTTPVKPKE